MGIDTNGTKFLVYSKTKGVDFSKTATLGKQSFFGVSYEDLMHCFDEFDVLVDTTYSRAVFEKHPGSVDGLLELLGARIVESFDYSSYEGATNVCDLNVSISSDFKNKYTAVIDGGTLEHVFNFPVAIKNAMEMLVQGGYYLGITPTNNFSGHGFYQFSPELYFSVFNETNGFRIIDIIAFEDYVDAPWFQAVSPTSINKRIEFSSQRPSYLLVIAQKLFERDIFSIMPQQSDYLASWSGENNSFVYAELDGNTPDLFKRIDIPKIQQKSLSENGEGEYSNMNETQKNDFVPSGERHIPFHVGTDYSLGNVDHMLRYALVAPFVEGKRVLDISCGTGYGSHYLACQGAAEVIAVDVDSDAIAFASKFYSHPSIQYIQSDAHSVPELDDQSFDIIVSFETIEHLQHPRLFLAELRRLLKPDGKAFVSCPNDYRVFPDSWISHFHLHKFKFAEFRDLFLNIFGEGLFMGQHYAVTSVLTRPLTLPAKAQEHGDYLDTSKSNVIQKSYLENLSSIENAAGYLAVFGLDESLLKNHSATAQNAFELLMNWISNAEKAPKIVEKIEYTQDNRGDDLSKEVTNLHQIIKSMENSKFWKARRLWLSFKRRIFGSV